jgi:hypothetical protein
MCTIFSLFEVEAIKTQPQYIFIIVKLRVQSFYTIFCACCLLLNAFLTLRRGYHVQASSSLPFPATHPISKMKHEHEL